jgi:uncharacterized membrane protein YphA (DoxX/SURF4 family)
MEHGYAKMARGAGSFAAILHALGVPAPHLMAWVSILTELLGGLAVLAGAFVALASVPMTILLLMVAIFTVHLANSDLANYRRIFSRSIALFYPAIALRTSPASNNLFGRGANNIL